MRGMKQNERGTHYSKPLKVLKETGRLLRKNIHQVNGHTQNIYSMEYEDFGLLFTFYKDSELVWIVNVRSEATANEQERIQEIVIERLQDGSYPPIYDRFKDDLINVLMKINERGINNVHTKTKTSV